MQTHIHSYFENVVVQYKHSDNALFEIELYFQ